MSQEEVSQHDTMLAIRRIMVALDASASSLAALEAAVDLAVRMEAELLGVFVEDAGLLRAAESPYARELSYPSGRSAPVSRTSVERTLRSQAETARTALAGAAEKAQVRWTFRSVRGEVSSELLAAADEVDLIAIGRTGWAFGTVGLGSTALELAGCAIPVLLLSNGGATPERALLVYNDGSIAARHAMQLAARIASADSGDLTVLLPATGHQQAEELRSQAERLFAGQKLNVRYRIIPMDDPAALRRVLRETPNSMLVLGGKQPLQELPSLEEALRESSISLLLARDGEEAG